MLCVKKYMLCGIASKDLQKVFVNSRSFHPHYKQIFHKAYGSYCPFETKPSPFPECFPLLSVLLGKSIALAIYLEGLALGEQGSQGWDMRFLLVKVLHHLNLANPDSITLLVWTFELLDPSFRLPNEKRGNRMRVE